MASHASSERHRLTALNEKATHSSFIREFLCELSSALTSDAAVGGSQGPIRERIRGILTDADGGAGPGRSALDARFALGADASGDQYLNQAVTPLWAGFGADEGLDIVETPPEVREASAVGMTASFDKLIADRKSEALSRIGTATAYVGWLMECAEVRTAILDLSQPSLSTPRAKELDAAFAASSVEGGHKLRQTIASGDYSEIRALLRALYVLLDADAVPMRLSSEVEVANVDDVVNVVQKEMTRLLSAFLVMGPDATTWCRADRFANEAGDDGDDPPPLAEDGDVFFDTTGASAAGDAGVAGAAGAASVGVKLATLVNPPTWWNDDPGAMPAGPSSASTPTEVPDWCVDLDNATSARQMGDALAAAFRAVSGGETAGERKLAPGWARGVATSPFWRALPPAQWEAFLNTEQAGSGPGYRLGPLELNREKMLDALNNGWGRLEAQNRVQPARYRIPDEQYVTYVLMRGAVGLLGPHEEPRVGDTLRYTYPFSRLRIGDAQLAAVLTDAAVDLPRNEVLGLQADAARAFDADVLEGGQRIDVAGAPLAELAATALNGSDESNQRASRVAAGTEPAVRARWAPIGTGGTDALRDALFSSTSVAMSKACALELLLHWLEGFLRRASASVEGEPALPERLKTTLRAMRAATKLRQLESMAIVANDVSVPSAGASAMARTAAPPVELPMLRPRDGEVVITRPPVVCPEADGTERVLFPVDAGVARLRADGNDATATPAYALDLGGADGAVPYFTDPYDASAVQLPACDGQGDASAARLTQWLRDAIGEDDDPMDLYVAPPPQTMPYIDTGTREPRSFDEARKVKPEHVSLDAMRRMVHHGLGALDKLASLEHDRALLEKLKTEGTPEREQLFGLHETHSTVEAASRDRRAGMWENALREVAVSTDRLLVFVRTLAGFLGEQPDAVVMTGDPDLVQAQRRRESRQKEVATRAMQFQSRVVQGVLDAALRQSNLTMGFDAAGRDVANQKLILVDQEARDNIRKLAEGSSGRPFFQASASLAHLAEGKSSNATVADVLRQLDSVGKEFHRFLSSEFVAGGPLARASPETLGAPHNCYLVRLKPDAYTSIRRAYQVVVRECRHHHDHFMYRVPSLWEMIEGRDSQLVTTFANLCANMLQHIRMTSGVHVIYTNGEQLRINLRQLHLTLRRMVSVVCEYVSRYSPPSFLTPGGREAYFGGRRADAGAGDTSVCGKRPERLTLTSSEGSSSDSDTDDAAKRQRPDEPAVRPTPEQLALDRRDIDLLIGYRNRVRARRIAAWTTGSAAFVAGGGGLSVVSSASKREPLVVQQTAWTQLMNELWDKAFGPTQMLALLAALGRKITGISTARRARTPATKVPRTCEGIFQGDRLAIAICNELEGQGIRLVWDESGDIARYRMPLPKIGQWRSGKLSKQIRVELRPSVTDGKAERDVSAALNRVFGLSDAGTNNGSDWEPVQGTTLWLREYSEVAVKRDRATQDLLERMWTLVSGAMGERPVRNTIVTISAVVFAIAWWKNAGSPLDWSAKVMSAMTTAASGASAAKENAMAAFAEFMKVFEQPTLTSTFKDKAQEAAQGAAAEKGNFEAAMNVFKGIFSIRNGITSWEQVKAAWSKKVDPE